MAFLDEILLSTREAIQTARLKRSLADLKHRIRDIEPTRDFASAISRSGNDRIRLVAEIKQASPSKGLLLPAFKPVEIARIYEEAGASALSVLTENRFFLGSLEHISQVHAAAKLPVLRKDFLIDEYQIYEARAFEADAVLLIVTLLDDYQIKGYLDTAEGLGMDCLVEVHTQSEMDRAIQAAVRMIGINNRDLRTFKTDLGITFRLTEKIPDNCIVVSESGIARRQDIQRIEKAGLDAVLIGETFMRSPDIRAKIQELFGENVNR